MPLLIWHFIDYGQVYHSKSTRIPAQAWVRGIGSINAMPGREPRAIGVCTVWIRPVKGPAAGLGANALLLCLLRRC